MRGGAGRNYRRREENLFIKPLYRATVPTPIAWMAAIFRIQPQARRASLAHSPYMRKLIPFAVRVKEHPD